MKVQAIKTSVFQEREDLIKFIVKHIPRLKENSVIAVTSKIVAFSQGRTVKNWDKKTKEKLIRAESQWALKTKYVWATLRDGALAATGGIDESNGGGKLVLLPHDSMKVAEAIRKKLKKVYKVNNLGIIITDSRITPLRSGVLGIALGYAGFSGLRYYRGKKDIFGRKMKRTKTNVADGLATACTLIMGEAGEQTPLAIVTQARVEFKEKIPKHELKIDVRDDMFGPLFKSFPTRA